MKNQIHCLLYIAWSNIFSSWSKSIIWIDLVPPKWIVKRLQPLKPTMSICCTRKVSIAAGLPGSSVWQRTFSTYLDHLKCISYTRKVFVAADLPGSCLTNSSNCMPCLSDMHLPHPKSRSCSGFTRVICMAEIIPSTTYLVRLKCICCTQRVAVGVGWPWSFVWPI